MNIETVSVTMRDTLGRFAPGHQLRVGHGFTGTPTYRSWRSMIQRCNRPGYYENVAICEQWLGPKGFETFLSDMGVRPDGHSLDRKDNSKGYSPENCQWSTYKEQARNRRRKTHCKYGHEFAPENTYTAPSLNGGRQCRACIKTRSALQGDRRHHANHS